MLLHQQFIKIARANRKKLAFIDRSTGRRLTYGRCLTASLILADKLGRYRDDYIGVMLPTSAGCALTVLATVLIGKVPVMINYSTGAETNARYAQQRCRFQTIVTSRVLLEKIDCPLIEGMVLIEDLLNSVSLIEKIGAIIKSLLPSRMIMHIVHSGKCDDTVVVLFTSGSEKSPKGVELTHRNISTNALSAIKLFNLESDDIVLAILPLFHVFGYMTNLWLPLIVGMTIVSYANPLEFKNVARIIREEKPTLLVGTPFFLSGYLKQSKQGDFSSLNAVIVGADKLPAWLSKAYKEIHSVDLYEGYGTTETSPVISGNHPAAYRPGSVGQPFPDVQVRIVDIVSGKDLPAGSEGKLLVKGDLVMKGYFDDVEETAIRIENGWYETGDMALIDDDGYIWHRGRLKRFVKIGGEMISLVRVESELEKLLPADVECCVVELPDARKGAVIVVAINKEIDQKIMAVNLAGVLPSLAVPKKYVILEALPKMGSGKIDFRKTTMLVQQKLGNQVNT